MFSHGFGHLSGWGQDVFKSAVAVLASALPSDGAEPQNRFPETLGLGPMLMINLLPCYLQELKTHLF
jgi:hypothetical protein